MVTAARCGALQLCRVTAWDQGLRVTVPGAGGWRDVPILPKMWGWGGGELSLAAPRLCTQRSIC